MQANDINLTPEQKLWANTWLGDIQASLATVRNLLGTCLATTYTMDKDIPFQCALSNCLAMAMDAVEVAEAQGREVLNQQP